MVTEPHQLTLWPDNALPGQLPLFNRGPEIGIPSGQATQYCERCESVLVQHFPYEPPMFSLQNRHRGASGKPPDPLDPQLSPSRTNLEIPATATTDAPQTDVVPAPEAYCRNGLAGGTGAHP